MLGGGELDEHVDCVGNVGYATMREPGQQSDELQVRYVAMYALSASGWGHWSGLGAGLVDETLVLVLLGSC